MISPLVTCICPTSNRRDFLLRAVGLFLAQDYVNKRLVIVEDGGENNADAMPANDLVEYINFSDGKRTVGEKRNIACEFAKGSLIAHWDDDDWHAPTRLSAQVAAIRKAKAELCGLDRLVFYNGEQAWLYKSLDPAWVAGGTLVYERALWSCQPFEARSSGEDTVFVRMAAMRDAKIARMQDERLYVARIHPGNTDTKRPDVQWGKYDVGRVRRLIGEVTT